MKVKVNDSCIGCGACQAIAPSVFEINDEGLAIVCGPINEENKSDVVDAKESCPVAAIEVE